MDNLDHFQSLWDQFLDKQSASDIKPTFATPNNEIEQEERVRSSETDYALLQDSKIVDDSELNMRDMLLVSENISRIFDPPVDPPKVTTRYAKDVVAESLKDKISDAVAKSTSSSNPVKLTTTGPDQDLTVTPNFSDGKELRELHDLKLKIEDLERKFHEAEVKNNSKKENSLNKEIASIRNKIEELSNSLNPSMYTNNN